MTESPTLRATHRELLCVDDDPDILKLRRLVLESAGYSVITANSGKDALQILAKGTTVDLVLLDYLMPGMNGDELAAKLRHQHPTLPLIAVSAVGQLPESLLKTVNAHVQKGRGPEVLLATISMTLERPALQPKASASSQSTVLCVEDEELQLKFRRMLFESSGYHVLEAQTADRAVEIFQSQLVDAVLMDYSLAGRNGAQVAAEMKRLRPSTPIVMLSGFPTPPHASDNVDSWLHKMDVDPEDLVGEVSVLRRLSNDVDDAIDRIWSPNGGPWSANHFDAVDVLQHYVLHSQ
jgi:CheY-like chemotaxis protein